MDEPEDTIEEVENDVVQTEEENNVETASEGDETANAVEEPAQPKMWFDDLPEDMRGNPNITKHKSIESISKAYIAASKKLGLKGIQPLAEGATPEQRAAYFAMRRGENIKTPNDYSFEKGSEDPAVINLKQALFDGGIDDYASNEVFKRMDAIWKTRDAEQLAQAESIYAKEDEKLQAEWGEEYVVNRKANDLLLQRYPEAMKVLQGTGADRCFGVQMMLRDLNARAGDAQIRFDEARQESFADSVKRIKESVAYKDEFHPKHKEAVKKLGQLYERRVGKQSED